MIKMLYFGQPSLRELLSELRDTLDREGIRDENVNDVLISEDECTWWEATVYYVD